METRQTISADQRIERAIHQGLCQISSELNPHIVRRILRDKTKKQYKGELVLWNAFKKKFSGSTPKNIQTLKQYAECVGLSMTGRLGKFNNRPTIWSVRVRLRRFCSAWERENNDDIPEAVKRSMAPYIEGELAEKIGLIKGKAGLRAKAFFTIENYVRMQEFHWRQDFFDYTHEGSRADNTNLLNIHCFSSARQQEICQSVYQDLQLMLSWKDGNPEFRLKFTREICKGTDIDQPEHPFGEVITGPDGLPPPLYAQPMFHLLANIISSEVCTELMTVDLALSLRPPRNAEFRILEWTDQAKRKPVFPAWGPSGPKDAKKTPGAWGRQVSAWAVRYGLPGGLRTHDIQREALIKANDYGYSLGQVLRFASQRNTNVLINRYLGNMSTIDGAANYLRMEHRTDLAENFRSATLKWNPSLLQSIPTKELDALKNSEQYRLLTARTQQIKSEMATSPGDKVLAGLKVQLNKIQDEMRTMELKKLKQLQSSQKIVYEPTESPHEQCDWRRAHFYRVRHMLPKERTRLAETMMLRASPRSEEWIAALKDLVILRTADSRVAFQDVLRPIDGHCPVSSCKKVMGSIPMKKQWTHVYRCYEKHLKNQFRFAQFCFRCSEWETSEVAWQIHCQTHFDNGDIPFRCDPVTFRYGTACAGYCPVHLSDADLPVSVRLRQYPNLHTWQRHISGCLSKYMAEQKASFSTYPCPHWLCPVVCNSEDDLWSHLSDVHSIPKGNFTSGSIQTYQQSESQCRIKQFISKSPADFPVHSRCPTKHILNIMSPGPDSPGGIGSEECNILSGKSFATPLASLTSSPSSGDMFRGGSKRARSLEKSSDTEISGTDSDSMSGTDGTSEGVDSSDTEMSGIDSDSMSNNDVTSKGLDYEVDCILAKWKTPRDTLYLVKWSVGGVSWQPEADILDQDLIDDFELEYIGFKDGIEVVRTRRKRLNLEYYIRFLDYVGMKKDSHWWVPEHTLHPDLREKNSR